MPFPASFSTPASPRGGAVVCHGYGGSKEQMLGIATSIAEKGAAALAIDLCGHGENRAPIGPAMREELEAAVAFVRRFGRTGAIGHSLGGRLALMSSADVMVAMSPSVMVQMSPQGKWMFENLPSPGVREPYSGYVLELLEKLGPVPPHGRPCLLLYSERDIQGLLDGAAGLLSQLSGAEKQTRHPGHPSRRAARERPGPVPAALVQPHRAQGQRFGFRHGGLLAGRSPRRSVRSRKRETK